MYLFIQFFFSPFLFIHSISQMSCAIEALKLDRNLDRFSNKMKKTKKNTRETCNYQISWSISITEMKWNIRLHTYIHRHSYKLDDSCYNNNNKKKKMMKRNGYSLCVRCQIQSQSWAFFGRWLKNVIKISIKTLSTTKKLIANPILSYE